MCLLPHSTTFFQAKQPSSLSDHYSNLSCLDPPVPRLQNQAERDRVPSLIPSRQDLPWPGSCPPSGLPRLPASRAGATSCLEVSVTGATLQLSPEDADASPGSWARTGLAHQSSRRAFLSPLGGGLSKRHLTSGQRTSPAFSFKKTFSATLPLFLFLSSVPTSSPAWPASLL